MKILTKISWLTILAIGLLMTSCEDEPLFEKAEENLFNVQGALPTVQNVVNGFFDLSDPANASVGFTLGSVGEAANSIRVLKSYSGANGSVGPIEHAVVNSLPTDLTVTLADAVSGFDFGMDDLAIGDVFTIGFESTTGSGTYGSGTSVSIPVSCSSELGGTYAYVSSNLQAANGYGCPDGEVTGEVTFTDLGGGVYACSDVGFGQYGSSCWGDQPATNDAAAFTDVCNEITSGGMDQYGLVYIWNITGVSGNELSISWSNDYGDSGDVVITNPNGWPALFSN